ncbi:MAG: hypothetical protein JWM11_1688 [Planctomycetaceae bacterium]|nr:hypothetical protein [Planctomycetaceae bacterium]
MSFRATVSMRKRLHATAGAQNSIPEDLGECEIHMLPGSAELKSIRIEIAANRTKHSRNY